MRNTFQYLAKNGRVNKWAKRYGLKFGAARFVAGESLPKAIAAVQRLNQEGKLATLDHLGEFVGSEQEAKLSAEKCIQTLHAIAESGVQSNLSVKMTSLGLDIGKELCLENMRSIVGTAMQYGNFVRIDMEDYAHCQMTLDVFRELRQDYDNVGVVIQAYLYRTVEDLQDLAKLGANLRLVKGAYRESSEVAYPEKQQVDEQYRSIIKDYLMSGNYTAIASHDEVIINETIAFIKQQGIPDDKYEFQMLYGISEDLQKKLVQDGYRVRIYVPYGNDWFGYFMRRLAERPANVWFVLKNLFK